MGKKKGLRVGPLTCDVKSDITPTKPTLSSSSAITVSQAASNRQASLENLSMDVDYESPLEKLMNKAIDEPTLKVFAQTWNSEVEAKLKLLESNKNPVYEEYEKLISSKKLDSNLKKCTGFVRKLKQYTEFQKSSIENDVKTLNLTKYLTEIAAAFSEARYKIENVNDAVTICSLVHQRYSDFSPMLVEEFKKNLPKRADVTPSVLSKLSVDVRMIGELVMCGVMPRNEGCQLLCSFLRNLVATDREGLQCLIPIMSFAAGLGDPYLGVLPRRISALCQEHGVALSRYDLFKDDFKTVFKNIVYDYFGVVAKALVNIHTEKQRSELHNRKLLRSKGEIPTDRKEVHMGIVAKFDKYLGTATKFSDLLDSDLPVLVDLPADPEEEEEKAMLRSESGELMDTVPGIIIFEEEETRSFYQDFKDLKVYLPPVAYRESVQQAAEETERIKEREKALNDFDDAVETAELAEEEEGESRAEEEATTDGDAELPPSLRNDGEGKESDVPIKPNFQDYLDKLGNSCGRNTIDKCALEFAENHNTKPNRKKLVHTMFRIPRQRIDLIPFYSRMVAILNPVMPDMGLELCRLLKNDFYFLVKKKHQIFIETKLKIVRFIGELVNFRIFPKSDALKCLKFLLMNFVHHQIEMACVFVETCGRMLYRTPDSHRRMKIYLEEMIRKKTVKSLEQRYTCMIDHAYSIVLPREEAPRVEKKLTPIELFLYPILVEDLSKSTYQAALRFLKCIPWDDAWISEVACRCMTQPWQLTHQQLQLQAQLLLDLNKLEPFVVTRIVDIVMEELRRGLENPSVHYNQRRFTTLSYLAELYYYRLIRSDTLFDVMYLLITYGVSWDFNKQTTMDPPDNIGRIRLASFLLKDCGEYLNNGKNKRRLHLFLLHMQKYLWLKRSLPFWNAKGVRFPFGIYESFVEAASKHCPKLKFAGSFEEAREFLEEMEDDVDEESKQFGGKLPKLMPVSETTGLLPFADPMQKYNEMQQQLAASRASNGKYNGDNGGFGADTIFEEDESEMDPYERAAAKARNLQRQHHQKYNMCPEDEEFEALFEKMCSEVVYTGKQMKTEITIPLHISNSAHSTSEMKSNRCDGAAGEQTGNNPDAPPGTVNFTLMTKKGNKQQFKSIPVPADSELVQRIRTRDELERAEKESVKMRTLAISRLQEAEEHQRELDVIQSAFNQPPRQQSAPRDVPINKSKV
ncbi:regulator of nonsense transcripts 2 isoform X3 [Folsomia candida]|uniref:regulator of nonsense transcripts 2 isoform X3 n=1 Tax=Folsomia candida TaxID=158441 RepID=UPI001604BC2D|nr:regulator of nonsense transcripts 2 isoform X3 [Folsomia candida]XP_035701721.1 regulator of nonsense transcripts 2 isoform X3 [Folsomia candida]